MKVSVLYEVIREVEIEVPDEVVENLDVLDFQTMWDEIDKIDGNVPNCEGEILRVVDVNTKEEYYC